MDTNRKWVSAQVCWVSPSQHHPKRINAAETLLFFATECLMPPGRSITWSQKKRSHQGSTGWTLTPSLTGRTREVRPFMKWLTWVWSGVASQFATQFKRKHLIKEQLLEMSCCRFDFISLIHLEVAPLCADPSFSLSSGCVWGSLRRPPSLHVGHAAEPVLLHHHSSGHRCPPLTSPAHIRPRFHGEKRSGPEDTSVPRLCCVRSDHRDLTASGRQRNERHTSGLTSRVRQWHFLF